MSFFGKLFGSEKAIDTMSKGVDALVFTDEEKSNYKLSLLRAYEPFRLIQRFLVMVVGGTYIGVYTVSMILYILSLFFGPDLQEVSKYLSSTNNDTLGIPFTAIMSLYFTGGVVNGAVRSFKE